MFNLKESFHEVDLKRKLFFDYYLSESELNLMEIEILVFLNDYPESNRFTDVMKSKGYAKSYVSKAITNLTEKQYIRKELSSTNKKVYNLILEEKSTEIIYEYKRCILLFRDKAFDNISEEELVVFESVLNKILHNMTKE